MNKILGLFGFSGLEQVERGGLAGSISQMGVMAWR